MRVLNYIKKKCEQSVTDTFEDEISVTEDICVKKVKDKFFYCSIGAALLIAVLVVGYLHAGLAKVTTSESNAATFVNTSIAAAASPKSVISIPAGTVKANPFLPYRDISGGKVLDVSSYSLVEPPEQINTNSDAARVMDTIVSGILYDKYSPSAILNIEGNDYLVKKGDVVNNYKVLNIVQDSVTVKLGANIYKAGIGEILTEGTLNHNDVSNLGNKFGGVK